MVIFNQEAITYDSWYETKLGAFVDEVETACAFSLLPSQKGQKVLDAGCGTGNFSFKLAAQGALVTAIDVSAEMLKIARYKAKDQNVSIDFSEMDLYNLAYPNDYFDTVISMAAFEFIKEPQRALKELFRVLKPGGLLLVGTIHLDSPWGKLYSSADYREHTVFKYAHFKTLEEMKTYYPTKLIKTKECLFTPPDIPLADISKQAEDYYRTFQRGGFICLLWKK